MNLQQLSCQFVSGSVCIPHTTQDEILLVNQVVSNPVAKPILTTAYSDHSWCLLFQAADTYTRLDMGDIYWSEQS